MIHTLDTHARQAARALWLAITRPIEQIVLEQHLYQPLWVKPFGDFFVKDLGEDVKLGAAVLGGPAKSGPLIDRSVRFCLAGDLAAPVTIKTWPPM